MTCYSLLWLQATKVWMVYIICVVLVIRLKHLHDSQHTLCLMYHQVVYIWHNSGSVYLTLQLCLKTYFMTNKLIRNSNFSYSSIPLSLIWETAQFSHTYLQDSHLKLCLFSHFWRRSHSTWYILWYFDIRPSLPLSSLPSHSISPSNLVTCYFFAHLSAMLHLNCEENGKK